MRQFIKLNLILGIFLFLTSCAVFSTSMTPTQVSETLPTLTKSKFMTHTQVEEAIKINSCKYLVRGREYTAPIGLTVKNDLKNGAKGIDEWVGLDGGNAYALISYNWETVDDIGSTQLHLKFDTMLCE